LHNGGNMFEAESIVEGMLAKAEQVISQVMSEFKISHVCAAFSGGDDSIVATHWAMNRFPGCVAITANTEIGLEAARSHQAAVCERFHWQREVASPELEGPPKNWDGEWIDGKTSYEEFVLNFGFPGPPQHPRMYQRLKQRSFRIIKRRLGARPRGSRILVISGIRQDESSIRAGYKRAFAEEPTECFVWCNPFYYCSAGDFAVYRDEFGLPRNPVKRHCGISGECCCGSFAVAGERAAYRQIEPEFSESLDDLETRVMQRFPWGWGESCPKSFLDSKRGQLFLLDDAFGPQFMPACVGCQKKTR
jgi:3'-phosphoadenosine 5'-phosphosulfate sulfotransferase (PAPS reductase)/FAD synthetase